MLFNDTTDCFLRFRHFLPISKQHCFSSWSVSIKTRFSCKEKSVIRRDCLEDFAVELYKSIITKMLLLQKSNSERDLVCLLVHPSVGRSVHLSIKRFSKNAKSNEFKLKQYNSGLFVTIGQCKSDKSFSLTNLQIWQNLTNLPSDASLFERTCLIRVESRDMLLWRC